MRSTITTKGRELVAQLEAGEISMTISEMRIGSGVYAPTDNIASLTALRSEKNTFTFSSQDRDGDSITLKAIVSNVDGQGQAIVSTGYHVNEIGIFVTVNNVKYLYAIAVIDNDDGNTLPAYDGTNPINYVESFVLTISGEATFSTSFEGAAALATDLNALSSSVSSIGGRVTTAEGQISALQGRMTSVEGGKANQATIAPQEKSPAESARAVGDLIYYNGVLYEVTAPIAIGDTLTAGTNIVATTVSGAIDGVSDNLGAHEAKSTASQNGAHGIRYYNDTLEVYKNNNWTGVSSSGGSMIVVTTEEPDLLGKTCTVSIGGATYSNPIPNNGICVFDGIKETGTATISANNGVSDITATLTISYYSAYSAELIDGIPMTISISTEESTLFGESATISYGGNTKTVTIGSDGTVSTRVKYGSDGTMTIAATDGEQTAEDEISIVSGTTSYTSVLSFVNIYGVEWDGTSTTAWSRTDKAASFTDPVPAVNNGDGSSPFDTIYPWKDIKRDTSDSAAGTLVEIPKFYHKWTRSGNTMKLQIADGPKSGFLVSPAHADRGDGKGERDVVYVGAYHCATSTYKSTSGVKPVVNITRSAARSSIHNLGSTIWQWDYAMLWTIQMLYLVEFADWNSQAKIGGGCSATTATSSAVYNTGSTDGMTYHTGTVSANHSDYGACRYRYIENLWGNCRDWCDGIYFDGKDVYCIKDPSAFSDTTGGTKVGERAESGNYISKYTQPTANGFEYALYPSAVDGTDSTYVCDYCSYDASGVVLCVGGNYNQNQDYGLFYLSGGNAASSSSAYIGSRLQKLP